MADRSLTTNEAKLAGALALAETLAGGPPANGAASKLRLFTDELVPDEGTTRADFIAKEATFDDYPAGGYAITGYSGPVFGPLGVAIVTSNILSVFFTGPEGNTIGGFWVEDDSDPDPKVRDARIYDPPRPLLAAGDGWPIAHQMGYAGSVGA